MRIHDFKGNSWKLEGSLSPSITLNNTPCIFQRKSVAFLFLLNVQRTLVITIFLLPKILLLTGICCYKKT